VVQRHGVALDLHDGGQHPLVVRARGTQCNGAPQVSVSVDGTRVLSAAVPTTSYAEYAADINVPAGAHALKVTYANDYRRRATATSSWTP
jgi:hypothetical protein